jgi:transcriptional regulator with XRE-family HTH domain
VVALIERILVLLKERNMTAKELTVLLGASRSAVSEWKSGKAKPTIDHIVKIAQIFSVSTDWLLGLTDDPKPIVPSKEAVEALAEYEKTAPKFNVTDEQLAAALPPDIRDGMMALIRIEMEKQKENKPE